MGGLAAQDVTVRFGEMVAVDEVSLAVESGTITTVLGPSGCGKSTLLRVIAGLQTADHGHVRFDGTDLTKVPTHRRGFALMFQDSQLFDHLSVAGNVAYALRRQRIPRREARSQADQLLEQVGLPGLGDRRVTTLSGGQQQRVALARALAARPRLLLLDEPLSSLDRNLRERLAADLRQILNEAGTTALMVTHDHDEALAVSDQLAVMRAGHLVQVGPAAQVWHHPVDAEVAGFLGYRRILTADEASAVLGVDRSMALRDHALRVDAEGTIDGVVTESRVVADGIRLLVDIGEARGIPAMADGPRDPGPVRLRWIREASAPVPDRS